MLTIIKKILKRFSVKSLVTIFLFIAELITKSTKTKADDEFVEKVKQLLREIGLWG